MVCPTDESFPKGVRIRKRAEYLEIQRSGVAVHGRLLIGIALKVEDRTSARLGITTTKRIGSAVVRNRVRRMIREAFRRNRDVFPPSTDVIVVAKRASIDVAAAAIAEDLALLGRRVARLAEPAR
jgi:ribonuclease P protein component